MEKSTYCSVKKNVNHLFKFKKYVTLLLLPTHYFYPVNTWDSQLEAPTSDKPHFSDIPCSHSRNPAGNPCCESTDRLSTQDRQL